MKTHLKLGALAVSLAVVGIATAADDKTTTTEPKAGKQRDPEAMFKRIDANGDGKVTKEEFEKLRHRMQGRRSGAQNETTTDKAQNGDRFFTHLDANNDAELSLDEFKKMSERRAQAGGKNADPEKRKQLRERRDAAGNDAAKKAGADEKPPEPPK